jgi:hypothetical protein
MDRKSRLLHCFGQTANPASGTDSADAGNCYQGKISTVIGSDELLGIVVIVLLIRVWFKPTPNQWQKR